MRGRRCRQRRASRARVHPEVENSPGPAGAVRAGEERRGDARGGKGEEEGASLPRPEGRAEEAGLGRLVNGPPWGGCGRPPASRELRRRRGGSVGVNTFAPAGSRGGRRLPRRQLSLSPNSGQSARARPALGCSRQDAARAGQAARPASGPLPSPRVKGGRRPSAPSSLPPPRACR